jgi:hypothetical protein
MIKIISVQFSFDNDKKYETLLNVLKYSAKVNMPKAKFVDLRLDAPEVEEVPGYKMLISNTYKLEKWIEEINKCKDGDYIALVDADMLILRDFSRVFNYRFDVAYTYRTSGYLPLNGGVIFVKVNDLSKDFFNKFYRINLHFLKNKKEHDKYRKIYAGMNQAAFGWMLEESNHPAHVLALPCPIWNVCNEDWKNMDESAYILHIKSKLRLMCFNQKRPTPDVERLVDLWQGYYNEMVINET